MLTSLSVPFSPSLPPRYACWHAGNGKKDFLQPGNKQGCGGLRDTALYYAGFTPGCGVHAFTYDPSRVFSCAGTDALPGSKTYSINEGNPLVSNGVKKYIKFCQEEDKSATARTLTLSVHWSRISTVTC